MSNPAFHGDPHTYFRGMGDELRRARRFQGMNTFDLAELAGLHPNTVNAIERGVRDMSLVTVARLFAALGCGYIGLNDEFFDIHLNQDPGAPWITEVLTMRACEIVRITAQSLRARRQSLGLTLEDMAACTGLHRNTLWNIEKALVNPSAWHLYAIHRVLGACALKGSKSGLMIISDDHADGGRPL